MSDNSTEEDSDIDVIPDADLALYTKPVMVTTEYRGVFFGYSTGHEGPVIKLKSVRNCISWSAEIKGVLGLAVFGPNENCRIGPQVKSMYLRSVTAIIDVDKEAADNWERAPWAAT